MINETPLTIQKLTYLIIESLSDLEYNPSVQTKILFLYSLLKRIPSEILNNNIHIFYEYYKNLVGKLKKK